jgi:DNA-binding GntR family transcriptional regulator
MDIVSNIQSTRQLIDPKTVFGEVAMRRASLVRGLRDQLVDHIRADVLSGHYKEGDAIRQEEVVSRYQVSRTPVREALIELENEGLLVHTPNCGMRVAQQAPDSVHELLIPLRRTIESYAVRLSFANLDEEFFQGWEEILERMHDACKRKDCVALSEADIAFHRHLVERAGEPSLSKIWHAILGQVRAYFLKYLLKYEDLMIIYREHAAIVETFRRGDEHASISFLASRIGDPASETLFKDLMRLANNGDSEEVA